jgi:hypothetical protein
MGDADAVPENDLHCLRYSPAHDESHGSSMPGTNVERRKRDEMLPTKPNTPINALDSAAKKHDYAYKRITETPGTTHEQKVKEVHQADDEFIKELNDIPGFSLTKTIASKAIALKKFAEKRGLIPYSQFSLTGIGLYPARRLNYIADGLVKQDGGFPPALLAFLAPIVADLTVTGIKALVNHFKGSGIPRTKGMTDMHYIAKGLDLTPPNDQIEMIYNMVQRRKN